MIVIYIFIGALALTLLLAGVFRLLGIFILKQTMGKHIDKPEDNHRVVERTLRDVEHHKVTLYIPLIQPVVVTVKASVPRDNHSGFWIPTKH